MNLIDFDYAVIRFVPSVRRQEFRNIGVILHAPAARYLAGVFRDDVDRWGSPIPADRLRGYVESLRGVVSGDASAGPIAALPRSERYHWLTARRSDCFFASPCHPGRAMEADLPAMLQQIFDEEVADG